MTRYANFFRMRMAVADLGTGACSVQSLDEALIREALSGAGAGADGSGLAGAVAALYPMALVLAAGPLAGSFAPASGLLVMTAERRDGRETVFMPQGHGAWLRASGFDVLVVIGIASRPSVIRCSGGSCAIEPAPELSPEAGRTALRKHVLRRTATGRAGLILADLSLPDHEDRAAAGLEHGSMERSAFAASVMRQKRLQAIVLEGGLPLPPMPVALSNAARARAAHPDSSWLRELHAFGVRTLPRTLRWKSAACLHCPSPCLAWVRAWEDRWMLCGDHAGFAAALAACGNHAPACLALCDDLGLAPVACAPLLQGVSPQDMLDALRAAAVGVSEPCAPERPALAGSDTEPAVRAGAALGLCPKLLKRHPALTLDVLADLLDDALRPLFLHGRDRP